MEGSTCPRCQRRWTSRTEVHCASCHTHFANARAFDRHQTGTAPVTCHPPEQRGLLAVERAHGVVWRLPPRTGPLPSWMRTPTG